MKYSKIIATKIVFAYLLVYSALSLGQTTTFEDLDSLQKVAPKNTIVFIHTDWCRFCQMMTYTTLSTPSIANQLDSNFYFIRLNGEQKENIKFRNTVFSFRPSGVNTGTHELALALGEINGEIVYPTTVFLNSENEILYQHAGVINKDEFLEVLKKLSDL